MSSCSQAGTAIEPERTIAAPTGDSVIAASCMTRRAAAGRARAGIFAQRFRGILMLGRGIVQEQTSHLAPRPRNAGWPKWRVDIGGVRPRNQRRPAPLAGP